jgi:hypothetical protein
MALRDGVNRPFLRLTAAVVCGLGCAVSPAFAQPPIANRLRMPEIWYGLQRVDQAARPETPPPTAVPLVPAPDERGVLFDSRGHAAATAPTAPEPGSKPGVKTDKPGPARVTAAAKDEDEAAAEPQPARAKRPKRRAPAEETPRHDAGVVPAAAWSPEAPRLPAALDRVLPAAPVVPTPPAVLPPSIIAEKPHDASPSPAAPRLAENDGQDVRVNRMLFNTILVQSLALLAAVFVVPSLVLLALCLVVRRALGRSGSLVRIEVVGAAGAFGAAVAGPAQPAGPPPAPEPAPPAPAAETPAVPEEWTAEPFELGPTYEEEQRLRDEAQKQQEEALLRRLFEENLKLQEQLAP